MKKIKTIKFPKGVYYERIIKYLKRRESNETIQRFISIDPSSGSNGDAGYAVYIDCKLVESGTLQNNHSKSVFSRIRCMTEHLVQIAWKYEVRLIAIELLRGRMTPVQLHWSIGSFLTSLSEIDSIEVAVNIWKSIVPKGYVKTDEQDAIYIGQSLIEIYNNLQEK